MTQLIETTLNAEKLPKTGGYSATVVVAMTLARLTADLDHAGVCTLDTGGRITAAQARRLACTAGIIPVVRDGRANPSTSATNADSTTRPCQSPWAYATEAAPQPAAKHHRACATPTTTPPWPHVEHTNVDTSRLLCPRHHRRIHDRNYETQHLPDGKVSFHRRT